MATPQTPILAAAPMCTRRQWAVVYLAVMLGAALCARALLGESYERLDVSFLDARVTDVGPTPISAALADAFILALSIALLLFAQAPPSRAAAAAVSAIALLLIAVLLSSFFAAESQIAYLAGANLWITVVAGGALALAARDRLVARFLTAALLATGATIATKCLLQHYVEAADTLAAWQDQKKELIARGMSLDDPLIVNYERRVESLARESTGYHYHANVTASCLLLALLPALGILAASLRAVRSGHRRGAANAAGSSSAPPSPSGAIELPLAAVVGLGIGVLCAFGMVLTGSKGGILAALIGVPLFVAFGIGATLIARRPTLTMILAVGGYAGVVAAGALYGVTYGTLPISSLAFRWYYWVAAIPAWLEAPWTGIGRLNFGDAFLRFKAPECVEDVRDPHNVWLSLLVEVGPLALCAAIILLIVVGRTAIERLAPRARPAAPATGSRNPTPIPNTLAVIVVGLTAFAAVHALAGGILAPEFAAAFIWSLEVLTVWSLVFGASWFALLDLEHRGGPDSPWIRGAALAAVAAVLIHALVDFALMTPAGLSLFIVALAISVAATDVAAATSIEASPAMARVWWSTRSLSGLVGMLLVAHLAWNVLTPWNTQRNQDALRRRAADGGAEFPAELLSAAYGPPRDAAGPRIVADIMAQAAQRAADPRRIALLEVARDALRVSLGRNPHSEKTHRRLAVIFEALEQALDTQTRAVDASAALSAAAAEWGEAIALSPTNPRSRIAAARALVRLYERTHDPSQASAARAQLERAREIDARRPRGDTVRLSDQNLREIDELLARAAAPPRSSGQPAGS